MSDFWFIGAPGKNTRQETWEKLNTLLSIQHKLSTNYKFNIPDLKSGTLDELISVSDRLYELDNSLDEITHRIAYCTWKLLEDKKDKLHESLKCKNVDLATYITKFQWDIAKYPIKQSLTRIADIIDKEVSQIHTELEAKYKPYNSLLKSLENKEKKKKVSLVTRSLIDIVKKEDLILDSEYLTTLLVVVTKPSFKAWEQSYGKLADMVVPRSSQLIYQDEQYGLFTVVLFKRDMDTFKEKASKNKFYVRDFKYDEDALQNRENEILMLERDKKEQFETLVPWLKTMFSECFSTWIHTKALRIFVESLLRYGLSANFQAMILQPQKKSEGRLRDLLSQLYADLDPTASQDSQGIEKDTIYFPFEDKEYYPYVYYKINIDLTNSKYFKCSM